MKRILHTLIAFLFAASLSHAGENRSPNILLLYADDLGYGDLTCYDPNSKIPSPNLDSLAATGMRFTDGHSSSGICTPSRYAMLTGRHHWRDFHGIVGPLGGSKLKDAQLTLPEMLRDNGYATACIGKWHLGWDWDAIRKPGTSKESIQPSDFDWSKPIPDGPLAYGFDHCFGDTVINFPPYAWIEDDKLVKVPDALMDTKEMEKIKEGNWECRPGPMVSDWDPYQNIPETTRRGVEYIRARKDADQPFFLYFAYPSPHAPSSPTTPSTENPKPAPTATTSSRPIIPSANCSPPWKKPARPTIPSLSSRPTTARNTTPNRATKNSNTGPPPPCAVSNATSTKAATACPPSSAGRGSSRPVRPLTP